MGPLAEEVTEWPTAIMSYQGTNPYERQEQQPRTGRYQQFSQQRGQAQQPQQTTYTQEPQTYGSPAQQQQYPQYQAQRQQSVSQQPVSQQPMGQQPVTQQPQGMQAPQQQTELLQQQPTQQLSAAGAMGAQVASGRQQMRPMRQRLKPASVDELLVTDVVTATRDTPIRTVVSSMGEHDIGSVVVVDEDGESPIGIVTDRKIALTLEGQPEIAEQSVEELLTSDLITGTTSMTIFEALETLNDAEIRRLPIVDEEGSLQGIVTLDDLLVFFGNQLQSALEVIEAQSRR